MKFREDSRCGINGNRKSPLPCLVCNVDYTGNLQNGVQLELWTFEVYITSKFKLFYPSSKQIQKGVNWLD